MKEETKKLELAQVVLLLPVPFLGIKIKRKIGFKFGTLAYSMLCNLYTPAIDFHQIDEMSKLNNNDFLIKLIVAGAHAYAFLNNKKCNVTEKLVTYWLTAMPAAQKEHFASEINIAVLNSNVVGHKMTDIIEKNKKEVKKK